MDALLGLLLMVSSDGNRVQQALVAVHLSASNFEEINIELLQVMATPWGHCAGKRNQTQDIFNVRFWKHTALAKTKQRQAERGCLVAGPG